MSQSLGAYLAQDRLHALANGETLPERVEGTVLFADIPGFTPLTEALNLALGARAGAEALSQQINQIYNALVAQVERWHGSVISFAGDALTCWFDQAHGPAAARAAACALALHQAMAGVNRVSLPSGASLTLGLKVALASGPALRLAVGDPDLQLFDALAGQTLTRVAAVEHRTNSGEILLDQASAAALGQSAALAGWRDDPEHAERYALLTDLAAPPAPSPWPDLPPDTPSPTQLHPWLLPAIARRYQDGLGDFLTELRPLVGMFIRFVGIDYDHDPDAGPKLDALTRAVQQALARYEGTLLQITIGDKGSSFYAAFGAPIAHEDDLARAVQAALDIQQAAQSLGSVEPLQIGLSQGTLIVGAYGAETRLTYAALGDEINLAARLMMQAAPGETLLSGRGQRALVNAFVLEPRAPIRVKGKAEPLPVMAILARRRRRAIRLEEPAYALPMVGRADEVRQLTQVLNEVAGGTGRVLAITGEAGLGKSRLVAELVRLARQRGFLGYGGACQATGANSPYLVWEGIWRAFFDIDPEATPRKQARVLEGAVEDLAPERVEVLPLLGPLVGLSQPDNDFTKGLQPKDRQSALHALLRDCLTAAARETQADGAGLLLVLEDLHWIDGASLQLLGDLAEAVAALPVLMVLAYRPAEQERQPLDRLEALPFFSTIALDGLESSSTEDLIRAKLAQLFPARSAALPPALVARLSERAQGNPFYLEELLNYLHDRAIDPYDNAAVAALELPESLYSLVLSRLDQLSGQQQALLKMASVIGRRFLVAWLDGAFASMRPSPELQADLAELARTDLTAADVSEPETAYLFKHVVTQQVAYESLSASTRAMLHERLAAYLEELAGNDLEAYLELLAYHYDRGTNRDKQRHFHMLAGKSAVRRFANDSAITHFDRVIQLTQDDALSDLFEALLERERVYSITSNRTQQELDLDHLSDVAQRLKDPAKQQIVLEERVTYIRNIADFVGLSVAAQNAINFAQDHNIAVNPSIYREWGFALNLTGQVAAAKNVIEAGLQKIQGSYNAWSMAELLDSLALVLMFQGSYQDAKETLEQAIRYCQESGNRREEMVAVNFMLWLMSYNGDTSNVYSMGQSGISIAKMIGDRYIEAWMTTNFTVLLCNLGDFSRAFSLLQNAQNIFKIINDVGGDGFCFNILGRLWLQLGEYQQARSYYEKSINIASSLRNPIFESERWSRFGHLQYILEDHQKSIEYCDNALNLSTAAGARHEQALALTIKGYAHLALLNLQEAEGSFHNALQLRQTLQQQHLISEVQAGFARLAHIRHKQTRQEHHQKTALEHVELILPQIEAGNLAGTLDPIDICMICHEVLSAAGDERAQTVLQTAHTELQRRAATIEDETTRARYLARPVHARLIEARRQSRR